MYTRESSTGAIAPTLLHSDLVIESLNLGAASQRRSQFANGRQGLSFQRIFAAPAVPVMSTYE